MFKSGRAGADVGFAIELAAIIDKIAADRVDDPAFGKLLDAQGLIVERIGRDRWRQTEVGQLAGSVNIARRPGL